MIHLTRINHIPLILNSDVIEHIEMTPDTVISLTNGQKFVVLESGEEVVRRVIEYRREILELRAAYSHYGPFRESPAFAVATIVACLGVLGFVLVLLRQ